MTSYKVHALWDADAAVWTVTQSDVPGLATEAPTVEALAAKLRIMIPDLLELNGLPLSEEPVVDLHTASRVLIAAH